MRVATRATLGRVHRLARHLRLVRRLRLAVCFERAQVVWLRAGDEQVGELALDLVARRAGGHLQLVCSGELAEVGLVEREDVVANVVSVVMLAFE